MVGRGNISGRGRPRRGCQQQDRPTRDSGALDCWHLTVRTDGHRILTVTVGTPQGPMFTINAKAATKRTRRPVAALIDTVC